MKEKYSQPIIIVQTFKISDELMANTSGQMGCNSFICIPNGTHCRTDCSTGMYDPKDFYFNSEGN